MTVLPCSLYIVPQSTSGRGGTTSTELPHLLEQEVLSLEQLLFTVFRLYCHNKQYPAATPGKDGLASAVTSPKSAHEPAGTTGTATHPPYTPQQAEAFAEPLVER
jgi:hypothetical protein